MVIGRASPSPRESDDVIASDNGVCHERTHSLGADASCTVVGGIARAGSAFHYMMLFENKPIDGAERPSDALRKLAQL